MRLNRKTILIVRFSLILLYLLAWVVFGFLYQRAANASHGKDFIFQEDVKTTSQILAFKRQYKISVPDDVIRDLIRRGNLDRFVWPLKMGPSTRYLFSNEPIGLTWALFYTRVFESEGITHFSAKIEKREKSPLSIVLEMTGRAGKLPGYSADHLKIKVRLYKGRLYMGRDAEDVIPTPEELKTYILAKEHTVWVDFMPALLVVQGREVDVIPIWYIHRLLERSTNLLDESLFNLQRILEGLDKYHLMDFLYFSAVTITTVGYGDILPNSTYVRILVMVEALFGVIIIGAFVSSLFLTPTVPRSIDQR